MYSASSLHETLVKTLLYTLRLNSSKSLKRGAEDYSVLPSQSAFHASDKLDFQCLKWSGISLTNLVEAVGSPSP